MQKNDNIMLTAFKMFVIQYSLLACMLPLNFNIYHRIVEAVENFDFILNSSFQQPPRFYDVLARPHNPQKQDLLTNAFYLKEV